MKTFIYMICIFIDFSIYFFLIRLNNSSTDKIEELGVKPLLLLLRELGGWPVLDGNKWNDSDYNWVSQMASLRNFNNDILISEWVAADITNSSSHIIQVFHIQIFLIYCKLFMPRVLLKYFTIFNMLYSMINCEVS